MIPSHVKTILSKSNLKIISGFLLGLLLVVVSYIYFTKDSDFDAKPLVQEINVKWPLENTDLFEKQVFIVELPNINKYKNLPKVFWEIENGALSGEMTYDGISKFKSEVNVSNWDWKKDNKYNLSFIVRDEGGYSVVKTDLTVYAGEGISDSLVSGENISTSEGAVVIQPEVRSEVENGASVYKTVVEKPILITKPNTTNTKNNFSVEWVPSDIKNNQIFIYDTNGYNDNEITVFWNANGGHKNLVFKTDQSKPFAAAINVFGWRWLGNGPYEVSFGIADKNTLAVLASQTFKITWKGVPGEGAIDVVNTNTSDKIPASSNKLAQVEDLIPSTIKTDLTPTIQKITYDTPKKIESINNNYFINKKLFTPRKPAVEAALTSVYEPSIFNALKYILNQPSSIWLNGDGYDSDEYIQSVLNQARTNNQVPSFVLYNIPNRDCGSYSSGGTESVTRYKAWIDRIAKNLSGAEAIVIVEPDALAQLNCLHGSDQSDRVEMIKYAVEKIVPVSKNVMVYVDAGHPLWVGAEEMADRLLKVGVAQARGFSLNVSNYISTNDNIVYGNYISSLLGGKKYIIDSSRNGNGPSPERVWCNPSGRSLGESPSLGNGQRGNLDAVLWIKFPGESDGQCNGGPSAGGWWTDYAVSLYLKK